MPEFRRLIESDGSLVLHVVSRGAIVNPTSSGSHLGVVESVGEHKDLKWGLGLRRGRGFRSQALFLGLLCLHLKIVFGLGGGGGSCSAGNVMEIT
ncbi:hypothetical protein SLA2020_352110 [Shorea laevis]